MCADCHGEIKRSTEVAHAGEGDGVSTAGNQLLSFLDKAVGTAQAVISQAARVNPMSKVGFGAVPGRTAVRRCREDSGKGRAGTGVVPANLSRPPEPTVLPAPLGAYSAFPPSTTISFAHSRAHLYRRVSQLLHLFKLSMISLHLDSLSLTQSVGAQSQICALSSDG
jgi:hypothetical protein